MSFIHFADPARIGDDLRPLCGASTDDLSWTTVRAVASCPACARLMRVRQPEPAPAPLRAEHTGRETRTLIP